MIKLWLTNPLVLAIVSMVLTFGFMFIAKKWYTCFTKKVENPVARRGANMFFGIITSFVLSWIFVKVICDFIAVATTGWAIVVSAFGATGIYLVLEKVFGESDVNELGNAITEVLSKSNMFEGDLTKQGATRFVKGLLSMVTEVEAEKAIKEKDVVDSAVEKFKVFLADGKITDDEKAEADKLLKNVNLEGNETYCKYKELLNK